MIDFFTKSAVPSQFNKNGLLIQLNLTFALAIYTRSACNRIALALTKSVVVNSTKTNGCVDYFT